jgi:hypothetical protein
MKNKKEETIMGVYTSNVSVNFDTDSFIECQYEPGIEAAYNIVAESEANYNAIMQAVGVHELAVFESTGAEMIYEATDVEGFKAKVKQFIRNIWEKIKGLFRKFFAMLNSFLKTDKEFINKYKKHLLQVDTRDFKYKGFVFTNLSYDLNAASSKMENLFENKKEDVELDADDKAQIVESMRGVIDNSSYDAGEFSKRLFKFFRNEEETKDDLDNISVSQEILNISDNSRLKKDAQDAYSDLERVIKKNLRQVENEGNKIIRKANTKEEMKTAANDIKKYSNEIYFIKEQLNILQIINGAKLQAIKGQNRQSKAICVALMNYKPKNESYSFEDSMNESFLSGVTLR